MGVSLCLAESEHSLRHTTMFLLLVVLFVGIVDVDSFALQVLPVHHLTRTVRAVEIVKRDKAIAT